MQEAELPDLGNCNNGELTLRLFCWSQEARPALR